VAASHQGRRSRMRCYRRLAQAAATSTRGSLRAMARIRSLRGRLSHRAAMLRALSRWWSIAAPRPGLKLPRLAVKPASGRMISLGRGGKRFSSATISPAPGAPIPSMSSTAHWETPVRPAAADKCSGTEKAKKLPSWSRSAPAGSYRGIAAKGPSAMAARGCGSDVPPGGRVAGFVAFA
jgi:hypothetical protein